VRIAARHLGRYVEILVEDDAQDLELATAQCGRVLSSQQRRAEILGGVIEPQTAPGQGTRPPLRIPLVRRGKP